MSKKDFWDGYVPEPDKRQQALDKKAENARELGLDYEPAQKEYERGFIDGMQEQMKRSVDRAINAMAQRTWVGLTDEEMQAVVDAQPLVSSINVYFKAIEAKLRSKNNG